METISNVKSETKKVKRDLVEFSLKRNTETGLTLTIKSPMFANFFKNNNKSQTDLQICKTLDNGTKENINPMISNMENIPHSSMYYANFDEFDTTLTTSSGIVNLSLLRIPDIITGIEVGINGRYSKEAMDFYKHEFKSAVQGFYMETMRAVNINCKVSVIDEVII